MKSCTRRLEVDFLAGEDLPKGIAVWIYAEKLMRAVETTMTARIPFGGPVHTSMIIGVTRTKAKAGHKVPVVVLGELRHNILPEWIGQDAWAGDHGVIIPWSSIRKGAWAKKVGRFTETGLFVKIDPKAKKKRT